MNRKSRRETDAEDSCKIGLRFFFFFFFFFCPLKNKAWSANVLLTGIYKYTGHRTRERERRREREREREKNPAVQLNCYNWLATSTLYVPFILFF